MPKDHFVSTTFLSFFSKERNADRPRESNICIYNKEKKSFEKNPVTVASRFYENGRDGNGEFATMLRKYEGVWVKTLNAISGCHTINILASEDRENLVGFLSMLNLNNPKKSLERMGILKENATDTEIEHVKKTYGDFTDQECQKKVRDTQIYLGHHHTVMGDLLSRPWVIFKLADSVNCTFITSDDPIIVTDQGWYVPLSKDLLILFSCKHEEGIREIKDDKDVQKINEMMSKNAKKFCASGFNDAALIFGS